MATTQKRRRAYIGNLRPRPNLSRLLHDNLFVPHCLAVKNFPDGDGIAVVQPKNPNGNGNHRTNSRSKGNTSAYALVEFGDVEYAIQMLNGVQYDGRVLRVSREKVNFGNGSGGRGRSNMGGGFGSSRWAGDDFSAGGSNNKFSGRGDHHVKSIHSKASRVVDENNDAARGADTVQNEMSVGITSEEEAINKRVESIISSEITESPDEVTAAIACTAAMALLSSVDAFGLDEQGSNNGTGTYNGSNGIEPISKNDVSSNTITSKEFQSRCKMPISKLLAEYGEQDVDWKKQKQQPNANDPQDYIAESESAMTNSDFQSRCQMPLSDLLTEYGEEDVGWKKDQAKPSSTHGNSKYITKNARPNSHSFQKEQKKSNNGNNGMLAHYDKAFVHLELLSFGYKYGAPSHSKRGFTYAQPLPPLDVRDLDRAPGHVAKFNGLSYLVKRALLNPLKGTGNGGDTDNNEEGEGGSNKGSGQSPMRNRCNEIADEIIKVLVEAIDEGGHGPISPLTMTVSIGSEYGRHRSIVLVEHLAVVLRARLRRNDGSCFNDSEDSGSAGGLGKNGIVKQPVSVGTRHRDVEARHTDEEAFGEDLKREARKAEKVERARRRQKEESGWDDNSW